MSPLTTEDGVTQLAVEDGVTALGLEETEELGFTVGAGVRRGAVTTGAALEIDNTDGDCTEAFDGHDMAGWSLRREITTTLPDQVRLVSGESVAGMSLSLVACPDVGYNGRWTPWRTNVSRANQDARFEASLNDDRQRLFTGIVARARNQASSPVLNLELDDLLADLSDEVLVPATTNTTAFPAGLRSEWIIDLAARTGGWSTTPLVTDATVVAGTMQGSVSAEVGLTTLVEIQAGDENLFFTVPWGIAPDRVGVRYELSTGDQPGTALDRSETWAYTFLITTPPSPLDPEVNQALIDGQASFGTADPRLTFQTRWEEGRSPTGDVVVTLAQVDVFILASGATRMRLQFEVVEGLSDDITTFTDVLAGAVRPGLNTIAITPSADGRSMRLRVWHEGSATADQTFALDAPSPSWPPTGTENLIMRNTDILGLGPRFGGVLVEHYTGVYSTANVPLRPERGIDWDPQGSESALTAVPPMALLTAREVIRLVVEAELGAFWLDEFGTLVVRWRDFLAGIGRLDRTVTPCQLVDLDWREGIEQVYRRIVVPTRPPLITANTVVYSGSVIAIPPGTTRVVVSTTVNGRPAAAIGLHPAPPGTVDTMRANTAADGSGVNLLVIFSYRALSSSTFEISLVNFVGSTLYTVNPDGTSSFVLVADTAVAEGERVDAVADTDADRGGTLTLTDNVFRQDLGSAQDLAERLAVELGAARPVIDALEIVPDLDVHLGDVAKIDDPTHTGAVLRAIVEGIEWTQRPDSLRQTLQLRVLSVTLGDLDLAMAGSTLGGLDDTWAGETLGDLDDDPLRESV
jgi:hypothetical protein